MMFPFLIGKVLTTDISNIRMAYNRSATRFPFLIGKVLTTAFKPL